MGKGGSKANILHVCGSIQLSNNNFSCILFVGLWIVIMLQLLSVQEVVPGRLTSRFCQRCLLLLISLVMGYFAHVCTHHFENCKLYPYKRTHVGTTNKHKVSTNLVIFLLARIFFNSSDIGGGYSVVSLYVEIAPHKTT